MPQYVLLIEVHADLANDSIEGVALIVNDALKEQAKITRRKYVIEARPLSEVLAC